MPSHVEATPLPRAAKSDAIGPGPLRTARGAGRFALVDERLDDEDFRRVWLPDGRDREVPALPRELLRALLVLRDAGGEDVRVAMLRSLGERHTSLTLHTPVDPRECGGMVRGR
jgi:hypothetical protein